MKVPVFLCCFFFFGMNAHSQNLVLNPGFEEHGEISGNGAGTDNLRGNHVSNWFSPTDASPDYFVRGDDYLYNQYGPPQSYAGKAMAGMVVYGGKKEYREYMIGEFSSPLVEGMTYDFSMQIALAAFSGEMISEFGICFTNDRIFDKQTSSSLTTIPQIIIDSTDQNALNGKWILVQGTYTAVGGEKYITIGNFKMDKKTQSRKVNPGKGEPYAYYYFDDISLVPEKEKFIDSTAIEIVNVIETPKDTLGIVAGKKLIVNNVYFDTDKSILKEESFPILDEIIAEMKNQTNLKVVIDGHTDSDGTVEHNMKLSKDRAEAVKNYFISKGIDTSKISTNGYGSSKPISADKNKNRRVEFTFFEN